MTDYTHVTEVPGNRASHEQIQRLFSRYCFARGYSRDKDVLEVACGAGQGLGYLAKDARRVVGGDYTKALLDWAQDHYRNRVPILALDAHQIPFTDAVFDVVILFEAIYYLAKPEKFMEECRRVLRGGGALLVCTANRDWADFNPSPHSIRYFSVPELYHMLRRHFARVETYGGFDVAPKTPRDKMTSLIKRAAVALNLMPKTMKGKALLKRIFFGKLAPVPDEVAENMCEYSPPVSIPPDAANPNFKVIYAVARLP